MEISPKTASDLDLKCLALELLAHGLIPFAQWASVFANPALFDRPRLRSKGFAVWFPTMIDFLVAYEKIRSVEKEMKRRLINDENVFELNKKLDTGFKTLLNLFSFEEQLFIRDRRFKNVYGILNISDNKNHEIRFWDKTKYKLEKTELSGKDYRAIINKFYPGHTIALIDRLYDSKEFDKFSSLYKKEMKFPEVIQDKLKKLGVSAKTGATVHL